ncbi:hypothetical protein HBI04_079800 [Parastagonospora nodorum]|nr:hypothetical protein HBH43_085540 [Parastagonospora nodorum]KAH4264392.1 hypothetical protein HBI03_092570 [Parastagonospora nodorum]KAH4278416.1 hypothetical protein HBI04_079800 [Parastagonospora nodorum]KAH5010916.1 hypothetical protein HBI74_198350 [Parastagonospora nodorum]KAH5019756.1 hypothetical protein HBI75_167740 [Parastagonospora nodorum]
MSDPLELPEDLKHDRSIIFVDEMITKPDPTRRETSSTASVQTSDSSDSRDTRLQRRLENRITTDLNKDEHYYSVDNETERSPEPSTKDSNAQSVHPPTYKKASKKARAPRKKVQNITRPRNEAFFNVRLDDPVTDDDEPLSEFRSKRESSESTEEGSQLSRIQWSTGGSVVSKMEGLMICSSEPCESEVTEYDEGDRRPFTSMKVRGCAVTKPSVQTPGSIWRKRHQAPKDFDGQMPTKGAPKIPRISAAGATGESVSLTLERNESSLPNRIQEAPMHAIMPSALTAASGSPESNQSCRPTLDERAYDMLKYLISLACQPNEWVDFLGPNDYEITSGEETVHSTGHRNVESFLRAALYKIDDDLTRTYIQRNTNYQNVSVILHAHDVPRPTSVADVWKPFSDLHEIVRKNPTSVAQYATDLQYLWKNIVKLAPHLSLAVTPDRGIMPPPPRSISFVFFLAVTCAPQAELQGVLEYLAPGSDQFNAVQDHISDGLKALRHEHPVYKGMSTLELTAIWARLNNVMAAGQDWRVGRGGSGDTWATAQESGRTSESQRARNSPDRPGKKRKADELEAGGMRSRVGKT